MEYHIHILVVLTIICINYNDILLARVIAEIWEYGDTAVTKSQGQETSSQTFTHGVNNSVCTGLKLYMYLEMNFKSMHPLNVSYNPLLHRKTEYMQLWHIEEVWKL